MPVSHTNKAKVQQINKRQHKVQFQEADHKYIFYFKTPEALLFMCSLELSSLCNNNTPCPHLTNRKYPIYLQGFFNFIFSKLSEKELLTCYRKCFPFHPHETSYIARGGQEVLHLKPYHPPNEAPACSPHPTESSTALDES